jgi:PAS domain S-box-containing protein
VAVVVMTGLQDEVLALQAVRRGVQDYLIKGQCEGDLAVRALRYAIERRKAEAALHESEQKYRALMTATAEVIYRMSPDWSEMRFLSGRGFIADTRESTRDWIDQYILPEDRAAVREAIARAIESRSTFELEHRVVRADGTIGWGLSRAVPILDASGQIVEWFGAASDVTQRRAAEEALRDREARLGAIVGTAADAIITIDERGMIESANAATERLFGYGRDEMVGHNVSMLMPEPYRSEHDSHLEGYLRSGQARIIGIGREVVGLRKDGGVFPLDLSVSEFRVGERRMYTGILHDITNRRRLEREILEASASEQRRIGHELHDGLCQQLTGAAFSAEILARKLQAKAPDAVPAARRLADEIDQAITQARTLARGLNPMEVHADGLPAALDDLASKISTTFAVTCRFLRQGDGDGAPGDSTVATHLYRIAQEAISNAIRHGGAKVIDVKLQAEGGSLSLSVADDGKGFNPHRSAAEPRETPEGIGLQTMSYRAKMINGILDVRPRPHRGVVVTCSIARANGAPSR